jgi:hypothetical protein
MAFDSQILRFNHLRLNKSVTQYGGSGSPSKVMFIALLFIQRQSQLGPPVVTAKLL